MKSSGPRALSFVALAALIMTLFSSCVSTPQSRIERNPALYGALNSSHKELVNRGRIVEGMSPEAVFLAWGQPSHRKTSSEGGSVTETWIYRGQEPVYVNSVSVGYGYGRRHHHYGYDYHCPSYYYGPSVYYRSYTAGKVTFRRGRVTQWEVTRP